MSQSYPFDPTGTNPLNKITGEQQVLTAVNANEYHVAVPQAAPFFADGLVVKFTTPDGTTRTLVEGVDYLLGNFFISASRACAKPIYGCISFLDWSLAGVLRLDYQTLGGIWTLDTNAIAELLANELNNPRSTAWEQVVNIPVMFPVINHEWNLTDMVGASQVVGAIQAVADAVLGNTSGTGSFSAHLVDYTNPHQTTAAQVGLGNVQNYPIATPSQASTGTNNTTYMTPFTTATAINAQVGNFSSHVTNFSNPHNTTAAQVGLGNVQNYGVADSSTALAGVSNATYMTPYTTNQVVTQATSSFSSHLIDHNNPHATTASQVGLGNVQNYAIASATDAQNGTNNTVYMTALRVAQAISFQALIPLQNHITDASNPHNTTKAQVGLGSVDNYATATTLDSENSALGTKFMTPATTYHSVMHFVGDDFITHLNATNPHNVTAAQVGLGNVQNYPIATLSEAQAGSIDTAYMTPAKVAAAIAAQTSGSISGHLSDFNNPHQTTASQVGLGSVQNYGIASQVEAEAGNSNILYMTPLRVAQAITAQALAPLSTHLLDHANPHQVTATQVGLGNVQNFPIANDTQAIDANNSVTYMTPRLTSLAITNAVTNASRTQVSVEYIRSYTNNESGQPFAWFKLGELTVSQQPSGGWASDEIQNANSDLHWLVMGGEAPGNVGAMYYIHTSIEGPVNAENNTVFMTVRPFATNPQLANNFGYTWNQGVTTVTLYVKVPNGSNPISVVNLNQAGVTFGSNAKLTTEPTGIVYITSSPTAVNSEQLGGLPASAYVLQSDFQAFITDLTAQLNALTDALNQTT